MSSDRQSYAFHGSSEDWVPIEEGSFGKHVRPTTDKGDRWAWFAMLAIAAAAVLAAAASQAHAVEGCKVKIHKRSGVLEIKAKGVTGNLLWGGDASAVGNALFNSGSCVTGGTAKRCYLADPTTLDSKTPPAACTLYLADDGATTCQAWIRGCTPGARTAGVDAIDITVLQGDVSNLQTKTQFISVSGSDTLFTATNIHLRDGTGATVNSTLSPCVTDSDCGVGEVCGTFNPSLGSMTCAVTSGLGNLIVGYDESPGTKSGNHNLIVGPGHSYTKFASVVGGAGNSVTASFAAVLSGSNNEATEEGAAVVGGANNSAAAGRAAILGGNSNQVIAGDATVAGGIGNIAGGANSSIAGGQDNETSANAAVVTGGRNNQANGNFSVTLGGNGNSTAVIDDLVP